MIDAAALPYLDEIRASSQFYFGVPAPVPVITAQIAQESRFDPDARSPVGAMGIMQFMPGTAKWAAQAGGFGIAAPLDPSWAIKAGVWYDRFLYDRVQAPKTPCDRWLFTLSAYNGGEKRVRDRQAQSVDPGSWAATGNINPGISAGNQSENAQYGPRIVYVLQPRFTTLGQPVCIAQAAQPQPVKNESIMEKFKQLFGG
jgi:soluble lytic murein transglycosylase-like protein